MTLTEGFMSFAAIKIMEKSFRVTLKWCRGMYNSFF